MTKSSPTRIKRKQGEKEKASAAAFHKRAVHVITRLEALDEFQLPMFTVVLGAVAFESTRSFDTFFDTVRPEIEADAQKARNVLQNKPNRSDDNK